MNETIRNILPERIARCVGSVHIEKGFIEEIRIRRRRRAYIIAGGKNILLDVIATDLEMDRMLLDLCHGSIYAYRDTLAEGYVCVEGGVRVGVIGRAGVEDGRIVGVYDVSELAIRLPNKLCVSSSEIMDLIFSGEHISSVLIYSPPGEGKTTLLRSLIRSCSGGRRARRTCVVDTRNELAFDMNGADLLVSVLSGYPRRLGIEIATRCLNAQLIFCDELGDESEASAIVRSQAAGISMIASCHGYDLADILSHSGIAMLHRARIFDHYVGIKRGEKLDFIYTVNTWEDGERYIEACR